MRRRRAEPPDLSSRADSGSGLPGLHVYLAGQVLAEPEHEAAQALAVEQQLLHRPEPARGRRCREDSPVERGERRGGPTEDVTSGKLRQPGPAIDVAADDSKGKAGEILVLGVRELNHRIAQRLACRGIDVRATLERVERGPCIEARRTFLDIPAVV